MKDKILSIIKNERTVCFIMFAVTFLVFWLCSRHEFNSFNNYSYLADAVLHGTIDVTDMPEYLESVTFRGHKYMHFAPGVSWISIPFVLIFGLDKFNCSYLALLLSAGNSVLAYLLLEKLNLGKSFKDRLFLTAMLVFGTVHFFCATQGNSWCLGHLATLFFLLLSFNFLHSSTDAEDIKKTYINLFLCGLFFGLAVNCRLSALLGAIYIIAVIYRKYHFDYKAYIAFAAGAAIFGLVYMIYNLVRYGTIMDEGYSLTYLKDYHREEYDIIQNAPFEEQRALLKKYTKEFGGPLQARYVKYNLYSIFMMAPEFSWDPSPHLVPAIAGVSLTFTSPMLYAAVMAPKKQFNTIVLWITTVATALPFLFNYGNGMSQFGMRYSMDFTPYLWILMCMGLTKGEKLKLWMKVGIVVCILVSLWGIQYWNKYY